MDEIRFEVVSFTVEIIVNGRHLRDHARDGELPFARAEGNPDLAGSYAELSTDLVGARTHHFRGEPALSWFHDGDTVLLGCDCGEWGCWPLTADVVVTDETVVWQHFRQGHRRAWDLGSLGPFVFDRGQYDAAVARVNSEPGSGRPRP